MDIMMRGKLRVQLTKLCKSASELVESRIWRNLKENEDHEKLRMELECLNIRILSVSENIKKLNDEIQNSIDKEEEMSKECDAVIEYEDKAVTASAQLNNVIERLAKINQASSIITQANLQEQRQIATPSTDSGMAEIRLKPVELKKFNGNFEDWLPFWEQYKIYVHENEKLPISVKFNYLNTALEGKAAAIIAGYLPTEQCYEEVINALKNEYGNSEKLIEKYVQKLVNIKSLHTTSDVKGLRNLYNEVCSTMRTLTALKVNASQYSLLIRSILLGAIPTNWRINYHKVKKNDEKNDDINSLLEFLKNEVEAIEKAKLSEKEEMEYKKPIRTATAASLLTNSTQIKYCAFCKNNSHRTNECKNKMTIEEKKNMLKREGRCFRCTNKNHTSKFCKSKWIKCEKCNGRHITPLCEKNADSINRAEQKMIVQANKDTTDKSEEKIIVHANLTTSLNTVEHENTEIFLQTAKAIVMSTKHNKSLLSRIIMDNGSQRTFITQALKDKLKLKKYGNQSVKIMSFGENVKIKPAIYDTVTLKLKSQYNNKVLTINAIVVPAICADTLPSVEKVKSNLNIENLQLADIKTSEEIMYPGINVLIGQDYYWKFNTENCKVLGDNLVAVNTFFGWTIQGGKTQSEQLSYVLNVNEQITESFDVSKFWSLESIGINNNDNVSKSEAIQLNINWISERYQVSMPWKYDKNKLHNNKAVALKRLRTLTIKLLNNNNIEIYNETINEMLKNNIIEKVTNEKSKPNPIYYMPHKAVYREDKATSKTRIVFDASSSENGLLSLNDHLYPGEDMVADLLTMLLKFRSKKYAIIADIEKAFLQISIDPHDRDVHRFWWYDILPKQNAELPKPIEYRMTRVTFGVTSSPYILASTIKHHLQNCPPEYQQICEKLKKSFYVDDLVLSESNENCAKEIVEKAYEIMAIGKFNLRKWNSNEKEILKNLPVEIINNNCNQKVLGVRWCTISDEISLDIEGSVEYIQSLTATKRNVLKAMAKIYDPMGMIGPVTVRIKILLQKIWNAGFDWDKILPNDLMEEFIAWKNDLYDLVNFTMKRCLLPNKKYHTELHIFADASPFAYGAVAYIRQISEEGVVSINFICSKNRIRPLKEGAKEVELTLPKLELTAALIAARMNIFLMTSLSIDFNNVWLWTDSTIALDWIKGRGKQLSIYVKTRVDEINRLTNIYNWNHCEGKTNPADLLTRGIKAKVLCQSELWNYGPSWLMEDDISEKCCRIETFKLLTISTDSQSTKPVIQPIMTIENFSTIKKLIRVTAWTLRFIKSISKITTNVQRNELTYLEIQEAETYWVKITQALYFKSEIEELLKINLVQTTSKIYELNPTLINGIVRLRSRIQNENPIILPKSYFTKLLISEAHEVILHGGVNTVLNHIRKRYWIIKGRQMIKNVIKKCVICKRLNGKPGSEPWTIMPVERLNTTRIFETTGIDFAGPLYVYEKNNQESNKVYILLFTCAAIRAVHLELLFDMTTKSCISALRRFFARYGTPTTIISDNAKTFKRTDLEFRKLENLMKNSDVQTMAAHKHITWKYIPERAAWWGGFWERLVKSVKSSLKAVIGKSHLNYDELNTILTEVEGIINARPLTYISNDHNDFEALTPAHFINNSKLLIPADFHADGSELAKSWQLRQTITKKYLKRWKSEYLGQLRNLYFNKNKTTHTIKVGDVVLVHEDTKPRLFWKLGLIKNTYPGRDGHVRVCEVQLSKGKIVKRPIQLLYPLEISSPGGRM